MDFLKRSWLQVYAFLSHLSVTARWLIGCLFIILVLIGWLMLQYVAKPDWVPITQFAGSRQAEAVVKLQGAGIQVGTEGGQLLVPFDRYHDAMVALVSGDLLAPDTSGAFDDMINRQSPWHSNAQNAQAFMLAKQKVLGQIVSKMVGVRSASVMLSMPEKQGFGSTHVQPSASVNVVMQSQRRVEKSLVEAIAGLVSGAVAEMTPRDVVVVDANQGRQYTVKSPDDVFPGEAMELVQQLEGRYQEKITEVLAYIPGVIVAVNVRVDPVHSKRVEEFDYEQGEPLKTEFSRETERQDVSDAGEAGARPNAGLDIASNAKSGSSEKINESRNEYNEKNLTRRTHTTESGHSTRQVSVTINVPRSYFVAVFRQGKPGDEQDPTEDVLKPIVDQQLAQIEAQVEPLVRVDQASGTVRVHMVPDRGQMLVATGMTGGGASGAMSGGVSGMLSADWAKPVGLGTLAVVSLAIMFGMVRKASQLPQMPTVEELAGVPPKLPSEEEITGEASEADQSMLGLELSDDELEIRRMADQIAEMVKENPVEAASLLNRWITTEA